MGEVDGEVVGAIVGVEVGEVVAGEFDGVVVVGTEVVGAFEGYGEGGLDSELRTGALVGETVIGALDG